MFFQGRLGSNLPRNIMEDRQLDFNQPLLSVRRFSSIVASERDDRRKTDISLPSVPPIPFYRSELKSGPIRNAGTVPFVWEQSPGRPKNDSKSRSQAHEVSNIVPKLPPGRVMKAKQQTQDKTPEVLTVWEAGKVPSSSQSVSSVEENLTKFESSRDAMEENNSSDSGGGDETYQDALEKFSRTESSVLNYSLSGVSGLDGPGMKASGTFSTDPQIRDFMMGRFLPAAKAIASETPQHASRKQPVTREGPQEVKKILNGDKRPPVYRSRPIILPDYAENNGEEESNDEDDGYDDPGNLSTKVCGLLPKFCILNPLPAMRARSRPGMSVRTRAQLPSVNRKQGQASSAVSFQGTEIEHTRIATNEQKPMDGSWKSVQCEHKNVLTNKSDQVAFQNNSQKLEGACLHKHLQGSDKSSEQNEFHKSIFCEKKGFLDLPRDSENERINRFSPHQRCSNSFQEILGGHGTRGEVGSVSPIVEKTLYVDSVHKAASPRFNSISSDKKGFPILNDTDLEIRVKDRGFEEEISSVDSIYKDTEKSNILDKEVIKQRKCVHFADSNLLQFSGKSDEEGMETLKRFGCRQDAANMKLSSNQHADVEDQQQLLEVEKKENSREIVSRFPIPPPLPKSPSESWLCRTLPSMSLRNYPSRPSLGTKVNYQHHALKTPPVDAKWEMIVKTTKVQHQH